METPYVYIKDGLMMEGNYFTTCLVEMESKRTERSLESQCFALSQNLAGPAVSHEAEEASEGTTST